MRIRVLGPMVVAGRDDLQLRDRTVLGVLVVRLGSSVAMDEIADAIWGDRPPATHKKVVQGCVVRLRRELGEQAIATREGCYALAVGGDDLDATRLARQVDAARDAIDLGDPRTAALHAQEALDLWTGPPLPELPEWAPARAEAHRLTQLRDTAQDLLVEATLLQGRAAAAATQAEALAAATPFREERWGLLARAQYAGGRQADALATIHALRATLRDELGIDPSPEVAALEAAILRQDPSLDVPSAFRSGRWLFSRTGRAVAVVLGVAVVIGVGAAVAQGREAHRSAQQSAVARQETQAFRLAELASNNEDPSIALNLAAEALATDDSPAVRRRVLLTLGNFIDLLSTGRPPPAPWPDESRTATSPDHRTTATARGASVHLTVDGGPAFRWLTPTDDPSALAFSPDGHFLVAGMSEPGFALTGSSVLFDVRTRTEVARFDSGGGAVRSHVFAPDGSSVWSLGDDGVHQWDLTRSAALVLTDSGDPVMYRSGDVVLTITDESVAGWIEHACALAGRSLTPVEWREYVGDHPYAATCR